MTTKKQIARRIHDETEHESPKRHTLPVPSTFLGTKQPFRTLLRMLPDGASVSRVGSLDLDVDHLPRSFEWTVVPGPDEIH